METLFGEIVLSLLGRLYLLLRYWNAEKRKTALAEKYDDSHRVAGAEIIFRLFAFICFLLMLTFIAIVIYRTIIP